MDTMQKYTLLEIKGYKHLNKLDRVCIRMLDLITPLIESPSYGDFVMNQIGDGFVYVVHSTTQNIPIGSIIKIYNLRGGKKLSKDDLDYLSI